MRDPHVVSLRYRLVPDDRITYDNPPAVEGETDAFRLRLEDGIATVEMIEHYPSEEAAKERVDSYLLAYEVHAALSHSGRREFRFKFDGTGTQVIDRNPPPPGSPQASLHGRATLTAVGSVVTSYHVTRSQFSSPPDQLVLSPDAEMMWHRYDRYLNEPEPSLAAMGYMCLSVLEASAGKSRRQAATKQYNICEKVLQKLGYLTSEVGDPLTARKAPKTGTFRPHTQAERMWTEAAVRALILRVGQWAADPDKQLPKLTMADLPPLAD